MVFEAVSTGGWWSAAAQLSFDGVCIAFGALLHGKAYKEAVWEPIDAMLYSAARHAEQFCPCYAQQPTVATRPFDER
jgi:hypothetical protein